MATVSPGTNFDDSVKLVPRYVPWRKVQIGFFVVVVEHINCSTLVPVFGMHPSKGLNKQHKKCIPKCPPKMCPKSFYLCGVEEMPTQIDGHFCLGICSTPHKMAWNRLWAGTLEYTFCVVYLAPNRHWNAPF